ncbi:hypothetical protein U5U50_00675 [Mycoplasma sp. 888]|uniref:hypothetical protein n=1 Tax=Mycoplasma sp. 888 TaxID=3108483 RepID=UPI002D765C1B|nr:hypothetical protein [Mycoplasma sp. 888]WRQ25904.1 hypothetical protein U5U50_00675 [Mycoplasma sp. 888]
MELHNSQNHNSCSNKELIWITNSNREQQTRHKLKQNFFTIKNIAYLAMYMAIIVILTFTPYTGYITIGVISITTVPIVILIASIHLGMIGTLWNTLLFGFWSWIGSIVLGYPIFNNILYSFVPRIALALFLIGAYYLCFKIGKFNIFTSTIFAFLIFAANTLFVSIFIFIGIQFIGIKEVSSPSVWLTLIWVNMLVEWGVLVIISIAIYPFLKWVYTQNVINKTSLGY